ncbi:MAG TPA: hypothetical protein VK445_02760 [Dissulfurispiraceae bacterium]|nr:hypothetical protein [Dissulfurispiraceae bacterium]
MSLKTYEIAGAARSAANGEHILGAQDTGSHACYLLYGVMRPGEAERRICPGAGHEELVLAARGSFLVSGCFSGELQEGSAFHISGADICYLENRGTDEAVYCIAGGHSSAGHHESG